MKKENKEAFHAMIEWFEHKKDLKTAYVQRLLEQEPYHGSIEDDPEEMWEVGYELGKMHGIVEECFEEIDELEWLIGIMQEFAIYRLE